MMSCKSLPPRGDAATFATEIAHLTLTGLNVLGCMFHVYDDDPFGHPWHGIDAVLSRIHWCYNADNDMPLEIPGNTC